MVGSTEIIVIVLIIFILFGAKSIPKFAKSIGEARKEFHKGMEEAASLTKEEKKEDDQSSTPKSD
tara:strand:+ start:3495 stop:3689 length:195 start_codon:yes stop_codon:yes gene_type:complete